MKRAKEREKAALAAGREEKEARMLNRPPIDPHRNYVGSIIAKVGGGLTFDAAEEAFKGAQADEENWTWSKAGRRKSPKEST